MIQLEKPPEEPTGTTQGALIPSFIEMLDYYEMCIKIVRNSDLLLEYLEDLGLVSINSEIAAARSESNEEVFMVLSGESARIAREMEVIIHDILERANELIGIALRGVNAARNYDRISGTFEADDAVEILESNRLEIESFMERVGHTIAGIGVNISELINNIQGRRMELAKLNKRFDAMSIYFRIEANRDPSLEGYFLNIADLLDELHQKIDDCITKMAEIRRYWRREVHVPIEYLNPDGEYVTAQTRELSRGNVKLQVEDTRLRRGYHMTMRLRLREDVEITGIVRRLYHPPGGKIDLGIDLVGLSPENQRAIADYLSTLL